MKKIRREKNFAEKKIAEKNFIVKKIAEKNFAEENLKKNFFGVPRSEFSDLRTPSELKGDRRMNMKRIPLALLVDADYNPRVDLAPGDPEFERIKNSIEEFGYIQPIIVNQDDKILSGHQRRKVLMSLGEIEADCVVVDSLSDEQEKALVLAMNKVSGKWDDQGLYALLRDLDDDMFNLTGFSNLELEKLELKFSDIPDDLGLEKEDSATAQSKLNSLQFGTYKCKISDTEYNDLVTQYHEYSEINRTDYGFISWILKGRV